MNGFKTLLFKELKEQFRTYRLLIVSGVFLFFGLTTPLMLKYLPEIIKLAGEDVTGIPLPPPTALEALTEYSATALQVGLLVVILITMGAIAGERSRGTAVMTLSKPVGIGAFVTAKLVAISSTFIAGLVLGGIGAYAYTVMLLGDANLSGFIGQTLLLALFMVFSIATTLVFSAMFRNALAAGGISIAVLLTGAAITQVPYVGRVIPNSLTSWGNHLVAGQTGGAEWLALGVTVALIALAAYLATTILKRKEI
ncbi:ABC-2 type transport system permease protein [Dehalogenimonas formicexedens]|uniref:ABC-2 type transport system permease protein n=1 Tax=Dehalogenimonas formicexedens TaxID=1839801 RepID=A0A1P8F8U4_9CHLR|nr:ABC transporter permease [Dehalogenimonas formicexedens]APV44850.1 ABC-2 type transport system permease protein [Dehalogenimonas formicexedens]